MMGDASANGTIRPFRVDVSEADLDELRQRIAAVRWPTKQTVDDASQGVRLETMQATKTGVSSARLYWESKLAFFAPKGVPLPTGVSVFPDEIYSAPRSWAEKAYPNLIHYNRLPKGGHFAAWEQPQALSEELRATFRSRR
jgi:pimeloyl-ACP methyl ester carboxylesterase